MSVLAKQSDGICAATSVVELGCGGTAMAVGAWEHGAGDGCGNGSATSNYILNLSYTQTEMQAALSSGLIGVA